MDSVPDRIEPLGDRASTLLRQPAGWSAPALERPSRTWPLQHHVARARGAMRSLCWPILVYLASRVLLLAVAGVEGYIRHHSFMHEFATWDGKWYARLALGGYPTHSSHAHTTLGFFPLYPMVVRRVAGVLARFGLPYSFVWVVDLAGVVISGIGGLVATVLVYRLAEGWWGQASARRAAAVFCLFPGSVVFSMVYAEGLLIPLAAGCILALERRRWLLAGVLAGLATATAPEGLVLVVVCSVSAVRELRRKTRSNPAAHASLVAPLLSLTGAAGFAGYLWARTGTPFATLIAQHYAWKERTDPLALLHLVRGMLVQVVDPIPGKSTYKPVIAVAGAILLLVLVIMLLRRRRTVSPEALVWTLGISLLSVTSEYVPPNPRLLITAFPAILVLGAALTGKRFTLLMCVSAAALVGASWLTFVRYVLPP